MINTILNGQQLTTEPTFHNEALRCFHIQITNNPVFHQFASQLGYPIGKLNSLTGLPFLPVEFFKTHQIKTGSYNPETVFYSSGTTNQVRAAHPVKSIKTYHEAATKAFSWQYGNPENYAVLGLLPTYLENPHASLISMVQHFIDRSPYPESGFFLDDLTTLARTLERLEQRKIPTLLIGVSFALLDFAEQFPLPLKNTIIMETGGMKGQRQEWVRVEFHETLKQAFNSNRIHSEYGMTELMSQAYARSDGLFYPPPWMKVLVRDPYDPLRVFSSGKGALNIIDLANWHSCAFLATQDLGEVHENGTFEVLGRFDHAELRGCNLMVPQ